MGKSILKKVLSHLFGKGNKQIIYWGKGKAKDLCELIICQRINTNKYPLRKKHFTGESYLRERTFISTLRFAASFSKLPPFGNSMGQGQKLGSNLKKDTFEKKSYRNNRP